MMLVRLACCVQDIGHSFSEMSRTLQAIPSFVHSQGTCQPINNAISVHRIHKISQTLLVGLMPEVLLSSLGGVGRDPVIPNPKSPRDEEALMRNSIKCNTIKVS